jgi:protein arginine kinase
MRNSDFVISSRVRICRNVAGYPFPNKMDDKRASVIAGSVYETLNKDGAYEIKPVSSMSETTIGTLKEKNLLTSALVQTTYGSLILKRDESVSVMINEQDHVVINATTKGLDIENAYKVADKIETDLEEKLKFLYSDKLGYLTASPSSVGTGLKVSVRMFLPALHITHALSEVASALSRVNISLKATANNDTSNGYVYELSSLHTLGVSEKEIIEKVQNAVNSVKAYEEKARGKIYKESEIDLKDKIMRSYGIATNCYKMSSSEMLSTLAFIRLGAYYKVLPISDVSVIDSLASSLMPYSIYEFKKGGFKSSEERNIFRASKIKETLKSL